MKMTRKLIPALVMLLVSAIMLSTASYAWFANNTHVEATGMTVQANTDFRFLQISKDNTNWDVSVSAKNDSADKLDLIHATVTSNSVTWGTGSSEDPGDVGAGGTLTPVDMDDVVANDEAVMHGENDEYAYVLYNQFYLKMSAQAQGATKVQKLTLTDVKFTSNDNSLGDAVRVLVTAVTRSGDTKTITAAQLWDVNNDGSGNGGLVTGSAEFLFSEITADAAVEINVYVFYDGEDTVAYTNNAVNSKASSVELTFNEVGAAS